MSSTATLRSFDVRIPADSRRQFVEQLDALGCFDYSDDDTARHDPPTAIVDGCVYVFGTAEDDSLVLEHVVESSIPPCTEDVREVARFVAEGSYLRYVNEKGTTFTAFFTGDDVDIYESSPDIAQRLPTDLNGNTVR